MSPQREPDGGDLAAFPVGHSDCAAGSGQAILAVWAVNQRKSVSTAALEGAASVLPAPGERRFHERTCDVYRDIR